MHIDECFHVLEEHIDDAQLPKSINFPFYYEPHQIAVSAAIILQDELINNSKKFNHDFGLDLSNSFHPIGKMFGVLVVQKKTGEIGFLKGFSGKLGNSNHHKGFVPPVFDILTTNSFFIKEESILNELNAKIQELEHHKDFIRLQNELLKLQNSFDESLAIKKSEIKENKLIRAKTRIQRASGSNAESLEFTDLNEQSRIEQIELKRFKRNFEDKKTIIKNEIQQWINEIEIFKKERKERSSALQKRLFDSYYFLNALGEEKSLLNIFAKNQDPIPPAGAGECAAPKLFQYAYINNYRPIALAEFWWGASPLSEIRKHGQYYPTCRGKCEPILNHMLQGLEVDPNPFVQHSEKYPEIEIIYQDDDILILNKPHEFLSVPGKVSNHSIYSFVKLNYPQATGPLIVHRLDMSTSGIIILALNKTAHKNLQQQFFKYKIRKKYIAILDGILKEDEGIINLPLRLDIDDRPRQMVCYEHGKKSTTKFKVLERRENNTKISFEPITGRTHQLRVHAAHVSGLNMAIKGDDLYGKKDDRLYLHAAEIILQHPKNKTMMHFICNPEF
jgi:tRNA pseudouridine32 synthase/23S rRNA pseudouridine746 synthase